MHLHPASLWLQPRPLWQPHTQPQGRAGLSCSPLIGLAHLCSPQLPLPRQVCHTNSGYGMHQQRLRLRSADLCLHAKAAGGNAAATQLPRAGCVCW
jgi:hypothetical protein